MTGTPAFYFLFDYISLDISDKIKFLSGTFLQLFFIIIIIWGLHGVGYKENIPLTFLKHTMREHSKTCNAAVYNKFVRFPLSVFRKIGIIKYCSRIIKQS